MRKLSFVRVFFDSFTLLKKCPRLYIPKILVAFFFFPIFILLPFYLLEANIMAPTNHVTQPLQLFGVLIQLVFILVYTIVVYVVDSFIVNPMYPVLVKQYYKEKEINFHRAFSTVVRHFGTIFPALLVVSMLIFAAMLPFLFIMVTALLLKNTFLFYLAIGTAFISIFAIFVLFYLIYPISSLEDFNFKKALKQAIRISLKHKADIAKAFFLSMVISGVSYLLGFMIAWLNTPDQLVPKLGLFTAFVAIRVLIAVFATYQYVLNAVFYLGIEKGVFLSR